MRKILRNFKKGFSLVECTVAMALMTVTCVLTVGIIQKACDYNREANALDNMRQIASNGMEIFKYSTTVSEFDLIISGYYDDLTFIESPIDSSIGTYTYSESKYELRITATYKNDETSYYAICNNTSSANNKTIFELNYRKYN